MYSLFSKKVQEDWRHFGATDRSLPKAGAILAPQEKNYPSTYKDREVPFLKVFSEKTFDFSEKFSLLLMVVEKSPDF